MAENRWLPNGMELSDGSLIRTLYVRGTDWQLYMTDDEGYAICVREALHEHWQDMGWIEPGLFSPTFPESADDGLVFVFNSRPGYLLSSLEYGPYPHRKEQAEGFIRAVLRSRDLMGMFPLEKALYIEQLTLVLPVLSGMSGNDARAVGRYLTGGVDISLSRVEDLLRYAPYLRESDVHRMQEQLGVSRDEGTASTLLPPQEAMSQGVSAATAAGKRAEGQFSLPGRPQLEKFFCEEIIEIIDHEEAYRRMGVGFPGATVLYGPPGCGKTYAVRKLTEYLGWPVFFIDSGSIGSKYVHETSRKISEIFDKAAEQAPSIIVIDEMEAFLSSRENTRASGEIHMEEVAEFLRRIQEAAEKRILLFGMTNMVDSIDKAVLRRGRFDYQLEVGMPSQKEIRMLLDSLLADKPVSDDLDLDAISEKLKGRPISDVAFVIRDAGRRTVRVGLDKISQEQLLEACSALPAKGPGRRRIGFGS